MIGIDIDYQSAQLVVAAQAVTAANTTGWNGLGDSWSISKVIPVTAGSHTIRVVAVGLNVSGYAPAQIPYAAPPGDIINPFLNITVLKK